MYILSIGQLNDFLKQRSYYTCIDIASHQHDGGWYMYHKLSIVTVSIEKAIKQASVQL